MSDTDIKKQVPNNIINYIVCGEEPGKEPNIYEMNAAAAKTQEANLNNIPGIPMEIIGEEFVVTNETEDGRTVVKDGKTGEVIGYLDPDGTLVRKLEEIDKKRAREQDGGRETGTGNNETERG